MIKLVQEINTKKVADLAYLNCLALKYIFDKSNLTLDEERLLRDGIEGWVRKVDITAFEKKEVNVIITCLLHDKEGRFDKEKHAYKRANIDYKRVYSEGI